MTQALSRVPHCRPTVASIWRNYVPRLHFLKAVVAATAFLFALPATAQTLTRVVPGLSAIEVADDGAPVVIDASGGRKRVHVVAGQITLGVAGSRIAKRAPDGALPDGVVAVGDDGRLAWLDQPTDRYRHGVLGDAIEAGGLTVQHPSGKRATLTLAPDAVFEDRYPRFADMDGDGVDEILVVKAYAASGGALALISVGDDDSLPTIVAEGPAIGTANRWLNPVGVGDVDGDGRMEALVVVTPHIGGTLTAYEWQGDKLVIDHEIYGFSNHAIGSRELALSAVVDLNGDGIAEALVPDARRNAMRVVAFDRDKPRMVDQINTPGQVGHRVVLHDVDGDSVPDITFGTDDGHVIVWRRGL